MFTWLQELEYQITSELSLSHFPQSNAHLIAYTNASLIAFNLTYVVSVNLENAKTPLNEKKNENQKKTKKNKKRTSTTKENKKRLRFCRL